MRISKPLFSRIADAIAYGTSRPAATMLASLGIVVWVACGFYFKFDAKWQLAIGTLGTVITLLMVFVIQHSQENDSAALHIKLDEIIRVLADADNQLLDLEKASQDDLEELRQAYHDKAAAARCDAEREI